MRMFIMSERLTWQEICQKYPNQQVGLEELERDENDEIKTAIVKFDESRYTRAQINGIAARSNGKIYSENTAPKTILHIGLVAVDA